MNVDVGDWYYCLHELKWAFKLTFCERWYLGTIPATNIAIDCANTVSIWATDLDILFKVSAKLDVEDFKLSVNSLRNSRSSSA